MNFLKARLIFKQTSNQRNRHNHTIVKIQLLWRQSASWIPELTFAVI
ncbi:hypothetical protein QFZ78_005742 [Paenibacillus sp. V4I5]|nr:hypothetical protein [Paenibacillus sp. V4I5]